MTIKELKEIISELPDDAVVALCDDYTDTDYDVFSTCDGSEYDEDTKILLLFNNLGTQYI